MLCPAQFCSVFEPPFPSRVCEQIHGKIKAEERPVVEEEEGAEVVGEGCLLPLFSKVVLFQNPNGRTGGTLRCHLLRALPLVLGSCVPEATMCCGDNWPKG